MSQVREDDKHQSHHMSVRLGMGKGTEALWSQTPSQRAIVFVHGFGGTATGTWSHFPTLLQRTKEFHGHDVIFYGYDGKDTRSTNSANDLRAFLGVLWNSPLELINGALGEEDGRQPPFCYRDILIVAHSLGSVVARQALLDAYRSEPHLPWAEHTRLVLFAPAHRGATLAALLKETFPLRRFLGLLQLFNRYIVLRDLEIGCPTLTDLLKYTEAEIRRGDAPTLVARKVILANPDAVVEPLTFGDDPPPVQISGSGHRKVCKPTPRFPQPLREVAEVL